MDKNSGAFLKKLRTEHNYTQSQVARQLGITRQAYAYYETHNAIPDLPILTQLAALYDVSVRTFFNYYPPEATICVAEPEHYQAQSYFSDIYPEYLSFFSQQDNLRKYHYLKPSEKKLLFMFHKLSDEMQEELLQYACFKAASHLGLRQPSDSPGKETD